MILHEKILKELSDELAQNKAFLNLDLGCYFPYSDGKDVLLFDFSLGMDRYDDKKLNHRYPNKAIYTLSKKYGRKLSNIGYPVQFEYGEHTVLLSIDIGLKGKDENQYFTLIFPISFTLSAEKPVASLSFKFLYNENDFQFYLEEDNHIKMIENSDFSEPVRQGDMLIYSDVLPIISF